ncbi:hypothetical protein NDU88_002867 [Pleurodeles waltl]|uniref:Uncharacterized protein n=1 Tax=Pleurodeles waltl TaxID=8319 RepID=A0AAV7SD84_PLEWA|nr:hypothetical protein NDU88_002867 [Pleurodeles waltl]
MGGVHAGTPADTTAPPRTQGTLREPQCEREAVPPEACNPIKHSPSVSLSRAANLPIPGLCRGTAHPGLLGGGRPGLRRQLCPCSDIQMTLCT